MMHRRSRSFRLLERREPMWFRWIVLLSIALAIAIAVTGWLRVNYP